MAKTFFPTEMISSSELTLETIIEKFAFFYEQLHLTHLQTPSHAEHIALNVWETVVDAKDEFLEKLMGYEGRKVKSFRFLPLEDYSIGLAERTLKDMIQFLKQLESFASSKGYADIENLSQGLSGDAAKTLYLLTQS